MASPSFTPVSSQAAGDSAQQLLDALPPEVRVAIGGGVEALVAAAGAAAHLVEEYPSESAVAAGVVAVPLIINLVLKSGCVDWRWGKGGLLPA